MRGHIYWRECHLAQHFTSTITFCYSALWAIYIIKTQKINIITLRRPARQRDIVSICRWAVSFAYLLNIYS